MNWKPGNWLRRHAQFFTRATILVVSLGATVLSVLAVRELSPLERIDQFVRDYEVATLTPPEPQDPNIVITAIKESTFPAAHLAYREPIDRGFLATTLTAIAAGHPRAIGLDVLLDGPTEPAKDEALKRVIRSINIPLVVAYSDNPNVVTPDQLQNLDAFVPPKVRGNVTLATDEADVARWVFPGERSPSGNYMPGFSRKLAEEVGVTSPDTEAPIVWHGRPDADNSAFQVLPAEFAPALADAFKNKIVLVGIDITLRDQHRTPFGVREEFGQGLMPGVLIQANSLAQLIEHRRSPDVGFGINLIIVIVASFVGAWLGSENFTLPMRIAASVGAVAVLLVTGGVLYRYADTQIALVAPSIALALALWASDSLTGLDARRQREFIHGAFSRYVSPKVVERLVRQPDSLSLEGERRVMTYLFSDIESFTTMSEGLESRELATILNGYLEGVTGCVLRSEGMVDKFIGDAVFAIFNAPVDVDKHEQRAVECALAMNKFSDEYAKTHRARGIPFGRTRIGINTGAAVIGNFGSSTRFNYTASGDAVNLASRLEGLNKYFETQIIVADATRKNCPDIQFRPVAEVVVMGKTEPIAIWQPLMPDEPGGAFAARYTAAYDALKNGDASAEAQFKALIEEAPDDELVRLHLERLEKGESGVVIVMSEK